MARISVEVESKGIKQTEKDLKGLGTQGKKTEKQFTSFGKNAAAAVAAVDGPLGGISSRMTSISTVLTSGTAAVTGLAVAFTGASFAIAQGVKELDELNLGLARTDAILKATGSAAGFSAEQLQDQAQELARATLTGTANVQKAQAALLTFNRVSGDVFTDAIKLSQDLAETGFGSIESNAVQLGKALQDPIKGMSALTRVGISFNNTQRETIQLAQESGDTFAAQQVVIEALKTQVGGAGESVTGGLAGATDTLGQNWSEFVAALAEGSGAYDATVSFVNQLANGIKRVTDNAEASESATALFNERLEVTLKLRGEEAKLDAITNKNSSLYINQLGVVNDLRAKQQEISEKLVPTIEAENAARKKGGDAQLAGINKQKELDAQASEARKKAAEEAAEKEQGLLDKQVASIQNRFVTEFELLEQRKALVLQSSLSEQEQMALIGQLQNEYFDNIIARTEEQEAATTTATENQLNAINSINAASQALSGSISSGLSSLIDGSKSAKEVALDVVTSVTDSIIKSGVDILVQKFITDNILKAANLQAVTSQVAQNSALAAQAAFASTSAIPIIGPALAPAAAAAAGTASTAIGSTAIVAAGARMQGGQVTAGVPYQVGERGVETFIPNQSGTIAANGAGESTGMTVNVYNQTGSSVQAVENENGGTDIYITRDEFQDGLTAAAQNPNSGLNQGLQSTYKMERN